MTNILSSRQKAESGGNSDSCSLLAVPACPNRGFTLIELIVAVGLFALVMTLASGAYLLMISINREVQSVSTGIDNLAFALEDMTRTIRTGTAYACNGAGDCTNGGTVFSVTASDGAATSYALSDGRLVKTVDGVGSALTDPSVTVSALTFYTFGTAKPAADYDQARVTMVVSGTVSSGPAEVVPFTVETGATMRGTDL